MLAGDQAQGHCQVGAELAGVARLAGEIAGGLDAAIRQACRVFEAADIVAGIRILTPFFGTVFRPNPSGYKTLGLELMPFGTRTISSPSLRAGDDTVAKWSASPLFRLVQAGTPRPHSRLQAGGDHRQG